MITAVRQHEGRPVLMVDGRPHHGFMGSAPVRYVGNLRAAGFDIIDTHPFTPLGWVGPDACDYTATDAKIESYLQQGDDFAIIVRFWLGHPNEPGSREPLWWLVQHPGECVGPLPVAAGAAMPWDELGAPLSWGQLIAQNEGRPVSPTRPVHPPKPSFASLRFRCEAGEALRRVVAHLEAKYGDRIAGYVTGGGPCGEWFHWHADEARMLDYSEPMRQAFHAWVHGRYGRIEALNEAWGSRYANFGELPLPAPAERFHPRHGNLRAATLERPLLDFYDAYHQTVADTLLHWAAKTKEGCRRQKAVFAFYGYLWNHNYGDAQARSGHAHLESILQSPDVDAIVAPFCYSFRQLEGVITGQGVAASVHRHGKLYVHELDGSTNLRSCWNCPGHHNPQNAGETGQLLRRELTKMLCEGSAGWYMDLSGGYFDGPEVVAELRRTLALGAALRPGMAPPDAQVAVVLDPRTPFYFREGEPLLSPLVDAFKQFELARLGLGFEDLTFDDLLRLPPEATARYRLWVFPSAVHLTAAQEEAIRLHACRNGNHVLWQYGVNVCGADTLDFAGMERLTGFLCGATLAPGEAAVTVPAGRHPWTAGLARPLTYGTCGDLAPDDIKYHAVLGLYATSAQGFRVSPRFFIRAGGEALGNMPQLPGQPCGLAVRAMPGWTSVLSCAPLLQRVLLRRIAAAAGCHVFTEFPGQTMQCAGHVGFFSHAGGECEIRFPRHAERVVELYSGEELGRDCDGLTLTVRPNQALLLRYGG